MLKVIIRSIAALLMVVSMVYAPLAVGYHNVRGTSLDVIDAFMCGVAVMCYLGLVYRRTPDEKEIGKG